MNRYRWCGLAPPQLDHGVQIPSPAAVQACRGVYGPEISVTERTEDMGDNLVPERLSEVRGAKIQSRYESGANPELSVRIAQTRLRVRELRQQ